MKQKKEGRSGWHQATRKTYELFNNTKFFPNKEGIKPSKEIINRWKLKFFRKYFSLGGHYAN